VTSPVRPRQPPALTRPDVRPPVGVGRRRARGPARGRMVARTGGPYAAGSPSWVQSMPASGPPEAFPAQPPSSRQARAFSGVLSRTREADSATCRVTEQPSVAAVGARCRGRPVL